MPTKSKYFFKFGILITAFCGLNAFTYKFKVIHRSLSSAPTAKNIPTHAPKKAERGAEKRAGKGEGAKGTL